MGTLSTAFVRNGRIARLKSEIQQGAHRLVGQFGDRAAQVMGVVNVSGFPDGPTRTSSNNREDRKDAGENAQTTNNHPASQYLIEDSKFRESETNHRVLLPRK